MTDEALVKRLCERAESYRLGGQSSEHTAALLDEAAAALSSAGRPVVEARHDELCHTLRHFAEVAIQEKFRGWERLSPALTDAADALSSAGRPVVEGWLWLRDLTDDELEVAWAHLPLEAKDRFRRALATDPRDAETTGLSWNGFNVTGDSKSIDEVRRLENENERLRARCEAAEAKWSHYAKMLDEQHGTPCEQIRHREALAAAQVENGRLRAALLGYVRNENGCIPDGSPYHAARCTGWDAERCGCAAEARAAITTQHSGTERDDGKAL